MRIKTTSLLLLVTVFFVGCDNAEISDLAPAQNNNTSESEMESPKDSIDGETVSPAVSEPSKKVDFVKIPTH